MTFSPFAKASILVGALALAACTDHSQESGESGRVTLPEDMSVVQVEPSSLPRETFFDGTLEAVNQATVSAQTSGRILELPYEVGDFVEQNALIVRITDTEQQARVTAAAGRLSEAEAMLNEAQINHDRAREIFDRQLSSRADYDRAVTNLEAAQARLDAAEATLAEAQQNLEYTAITAPYAGILVERHVQVGETVSPGVPLLTGLSLQNLRAVVEIPQQHIGPLRQHNSASVVLPDGQRVEAINLRIPPAADAATQTFRVQVDLPELENAVFPGTLVKVGFVTGEESRLVVPASALVRRGEVTALYLEQNGFLTMRYVRVGTPAADGQVPVIAGLVAGESVVLDPARAAQLIYSAAAEGE